MSTRNPSTNGRKATDSSASLRAALGPGYAVGVTESVIRQATTG